MNQSAMTISFIAYFDYGRVGDKLVVRSRKRGDRFQPLGMKETKKIGQFMIDARIPRDWRDRIPIVISGKEFCGWPDTGLMKG